VADDVRSVAAGLPTTLRLGTSSWSFPGWKGIVWDRDATSGQLSRRGLVAYSAHPVLRAVGVDRTYYAPVDASTFADYAGQVPDDFRFMVKAAMECTSPWMREGGRDTMESNPRFLDASWTAGAVVEPLVEGLGAKAGPLVFQFSPLGSKFTKEPARFVDLLGGFLATLPKGVAYAVEIRDRELLSEAYVAALRENGVSHCVNVHPRMPPVGEQIEIAGSLDEPSLLVRWMLHSGLAYEEAKDRYAPFSRIVDPDTACRRQIANLVVERSRRSNETIVIANNKAEGSAPLTLIELAREVATL